MLIFHCPSSNQTHTFIIRYFFFPILNFPTIRHSKRELGIWIDPEESKIFTVKTIWFCENKI